MTRENTILVFVIGFWYHMALQHNLLNVDLVTSHLQLQEQSLRLHLELLLLRLFLAI